MTCDQCGHVFRIGDFPFCGPNGHERAKWSVISDDVPGGFTVENGFDEPRTFYSKSEHARALAERGLEIRAKYAGPNDKVMSNWAAGSVDLEGAKRLVRNRYADEDIEQPLDVVITKTDTGETFRVEMTS